MVAPLSVTPRWSGMRSTTGCGVRRVELGRVGAGQAAHVARELDDRHLHAEADAEERHLASRGRSGPRRSCPRCRARRSRARPGCRRRRRACAVGAAAARSPRSRCGGWSTRQSLAMPPWISASLRLLYDSTSCDVLADEADRRPRAAGCLIRSTTSLPRRSRRGRARPDVEQLGELVVEALLVEARCGSS